MSKEYPTLVRYEGGIDFRCPKCKEGLEWNHNLYSFNKEYVRCIHCDHIFCVTRYETFTYEVETC